MFIFFILLLLPIVTIVLLNKFKVIDISFSLMLLTISNIKNSLKGDILDLKSGYTTIKKNRWHLHALIGLATTFSMLVFILGIPFWQQLILIPYISFLIQAVRELYLVKKGNPADFSDPRFGMYGSLIGILLYGLLSIFIVFNIWILIIISIIIYAFVYHLVFNKKH